MHNDTVPDIDPVVTRDSLNSLLRLWNSDASMFTSRSGVHPAQFVTTYALAAHTERLARAMIALEDVDFALEIYPTVRAGFESSITACWLAAVPSAAAAFVNEDLRHRGLQIDDVLKGFGATSSSESLLAIKATLTGRYETQAQASASNFKKRCDDLAPAGTAAYAIYRILSWHAHPSAWVAEHYYEDRGSDELPALRRRPDRFGGDTSLGSWLMAASVVWAHRAILSLADMPDADLIAELSHIAEALEITPELTAA